MSRALPSHANLEHLKKQAKDLLRELQRKTPSSKLADAQHAIARDYGFASWPKLKAHVESLARPAKGPVKKNPFAGNWTANLAKSKPHPSRPFQRATIQIDVVGDTVTFTDHVLEASGQEERSSHSVQADGQERPSGPGYVVVARWLGSHVLEVVRKKDSEVVDRATYEVSTDGNTFLLCQERAGNK